MRRWIFAILLAVPLVVAAAPTCRAPAGTCTAGMDCCPIAKQRPAKRAPKAPPKRKAKPKQKLVPHPGFGGMF